MSKNYVIGFPRIGEKRELKKVLEDYWAKKVDFSEVTTPQDRVAVITTEPLTHNESWTAYQSGEMILFQHGQPIKHALTRVERLIREAENPNLKRVTRADQY